MWWASKALLFVGLLGFVNLTLPQTWAMRLYVFALGGLIYCAGMVDAWSRER